jgi:putative ABC transport system permease protein
VTVFFSTSAKIAWRELRSAPAKFLFVVLAVAVGVGALSGVKGFGLAFKSMLLRNAKQLIAADLQAQVWNAPTEEQLKKVQLAASKRGVMTRVTETISMAGSDHSSVPQMVSVKAVDPSVYPLYGELVVEPKEPLATLLKDDTALVNPELLLRLKLKPGDQLRLGGKNYLIAGTLVTETDRLASGFGPGMRVLISRSGLERSGLIQFGSRAAQRFLFKLNPGVNVDKLKDELKDALPHTFISDFRDGDAAVARGIDNATIFLSLISLIALIVGSLGVAMAMYSHLQQKMDTIAVMKAVGARSNQIMQIYLLQTLWLGIAGGLIGVAIGAAVQRAFPLLIKQVFEMLPEVTFDWSFSLQGMCLGVLATLLFTVPPLLGIRNIRPSLVFRREMADAKKPWRERWRDARASFAVAFLILIAFGLITVWLSDSWKMGAYFIGGLTVSLIILTAAAGLLLRVMRFLVRWRGRRLPSTFRHGFANLYRPGNQARSVLAALGIGVMFTLTTYLLQKTILHEVITEGPGRSGNLFLLDVQTSQREDLSKLVEAQPGIDGKVEFIGYVVARLLKKNGVPADQLPNLSKERRDRLQTSRVTMMPQMPNTVELAEGHWWKPGDATPQAAVAEDERRFYDFKLGDRLQYQIAGRTMEFPIVATFKRTARSTVRLDVVVPRDAMKGLPAVYVGSVRVTPKDIPTVEAAVFDKYPTVTVMNLAEILKRIQEGVDQVALVIRFLAAFAILAGIIILSASVAGTRYRRIREVAILKTLGATKQRITGIFSIEFCILGAVAGLIGGVLANIFSKVIAEKFVEASFSFDWLSLLVVTVGTALLANLAGWAASARILDQRPLEVLRGE